MILIAGRIVIWANYYQATSEAGKVGEVGRASAADRCRRYPVREENFSSVCCFLPFVPENRRIWIIDDQIEIEGNARFGHCADTPFAFPFTDTESPRRSEERRVGKECVRRVVLGGRRLIKKTIYAHNSITGCRNNTTIQT